MKVPNFSSSFSYFSNNVFFDIYVADRYHHSHKKRRDSLEGSLVQVLFTTELEFPKILVPRLPQNTSNVNIENAGKSKQLYYLRDQLLGALIYLHFIALILICF